MFGFRLPKAGTNLAGPPAYLQVPGFQSCLESKDMGSFKAWCLPCERPEGCAEASWDALSEMEGLTACAGAGEEEE